MKTTQTTTVSNSEALEAIFNQSPSVECFMFSLWQFWCDSVTANTREFQQVLANRPVNKWFLTELKKEEDECEKLLLSYTNVSQSDRNRLYLKCIYKLFSRFPQSLLENAKKRQEKPQATKVAGHRIEFSIINQN
jgi:hypothetical protein